MTHSTTITVRWQGIYENACLYSIMSWKQSRVVQTLAYQDELVKLRLQ